MNLASLSRKASALLPRLRTSHSTTSLMQQPRTYSSESQALVFSRYGNPLDVLEVKSVPLAPLGQDDVLVEILAAPINPSDINCIQGKYPLRPTPPAVAGMEGVGKVLSVGTNVRSLSPGEWVVPIKSSLGTWTQAAIFPAAALHPVPNTLPLQEAATMTINPPTALRMLQEFVELGPGDAVVQNGANSAVGQLVIQMARARGLHTINVVRDRPDFESLANQLKSLGADVVTTEERLKEDLATSGLPQPRLALNCVGGSAATAIAKALCNGGTHVTYGGMSLQPVALPTSLLIFKDLRFRGFWLSGGYAREGDGEGKRAVLDQVAGMIGRGEIKTEVRRVPLHDFRAALDPQRKGGKVLLVPTQWGGPGESDA